MDNKKIIHFKGSEKTISYGGCNRVKLAPASYVVEKYWYEIIKDIFEYEKERGAGLQEVHKLFNDDRLLQGLKLYKEGKVVEGAVTDVDVRAQVEGSSGKMYTVTMKQWKPEKMLRHRYEMERYLSEMFIDCQCQDHIIHHYRSNSSIVCKHIAAVLWKLQEEYDMPKFLITPKEKEDDYYEKSKTKEIERGLYGLSMKQFSQYLNVLILRDFKGVPSSLAYSIHKEPNKGYEKMYPNQITPTWITFDNVETVERLIKSNIRGYVEMLASRKNSHEDILQAIRNLIPKDVHKEDEEKEEEVIKKLNLKQKLYFISKTLLMMISLSKGKLKNKLLKWRIKKKL